MTTYREKLLAKGKRQLKTVEVDGDQFLLMPPSVLEHTQWQVEMGKRSNDEGNVSAEDYAEMKCRLVAMCLVEEDGVTRCFQPDEWQELQQLGHVVEALYDHCHGVVPNLNKEVKEQRGN